MKIRFREYFRTIKKTLPAVAIFAGVCFVAGLAMPANFLEKVMTLLGERYSGIEFSFRGIFVNNLIAATAMTLGGFLIGLPTAVSGGANFFFIGAAAAYAIRNGSGGMFLLSVAPHALFELPAIFLSMLGGLVIAVTILRGGRMTGEMNDPGGSGLAFVIVHALAVFGMMVVPALAIAATVETYVTPALLRLAGAL